VTRRQGFEKLPLTDKIQQAEDKSELSTVRRTQYDRPSWRQLYLLDKADRIKNKFVQNICVRTKMGNILPENAFTLLNN